MVTKDIVKGDVNSQENKQKKEVKKKKAQDETSCWNCFTTELRDKDPDPGPLKLADIRKANRKNMKLYSFFAAELSKPSAISLKQKVSENYVIGKKLEEKITKDTKPADNLYLSQESKISAIPTSELKGNSTTKQSTEQKNEKYVSELLESNILEEEIYKSAVHQQNLQVEPIQKTQKTDSDVKQLVHDTQTTVCVENTSKHSNTPELITATTSASLFASKPIAAKRNKLTSHSANLSKIKELPGNSQFSPQEQEIKPTTLTIDTVTVLHKVNVPCPETLPLSNSSEFIATKYSPSVSSNEVDLVVTKNTQHDIAESPHTLDEETSLEPVCIEKTSVESTSDSEAKTIELFKSKTKFVSLKQIIDLNEKSTFKQTVTSDVSSLDSQYNIKDINKSTDLSGQTIGSKKASHVEITGKNVKDTENESTLQESNSSLSKSRNTTDMNFRDTITEDEESDYDIPNIPPTVLHISESDESEIESKRKHLPKLSHSKETNIISITEPNSMKNTVKPITANITKTYLTNAYASIGDDSEEKIVHKIEIKTSTPKSIQKDVMETNAGVTSLTENTSKKLDEIEKIIQGIEKISIDNRGALEEKIIDKQTDNVSTNDSESGYAGSSLRDFNEIDGNARIIKDPANSGGFKTSQSDHDISSTPNFRTSLSSLKSPQKGGILSMSTKSLCFSPSRIPVRKVRWSTLSLARKSNNDEMYMSDALSPGHATLPRRSNSPLPHERDLLDRDRFPLNRSGLQARSESMASVYSGAGEGTRGTVMVRGEVQVSLLYNYRLGALEVGVKRCRDLAPVDVKRNRSDPYVKVYLLPDKSKAGKRKTKVKKNTLSPVFEETLSFAQPLASLSARTLWLSVWHADMFGRNDFLGEVTLPLADVVFDDPAPTWYKLHERTEQFDEHQGSRGDLIVALKFEPHETDAMRGKGTLHVLIKEAKNLVATKPNGLADVFCKSYLLPERGRLGKQKTGVARRTLNPRWEHACAYRGLRAADLAARALELSLWDRDRLASNDFMGAVRLSLGTGQYMGANVNWMDSVGKEVDLWQTMLSRPNLWVERSLPLRPQLNN